MWATRSMSDATTCRNLIHGQGHVRLGLNYSEMCENGRFHIGYLLQARLLRQYACDQKTSGDYDTLRQYLNFSRTYF